MLKPVYLPNAATYDDPSQKQFSTVGRGKVEI
jgi:hypothetical protein